MGFFQYLAVIFYQHIVILSLLLSLVFFPRFFIAINPSLIQSFLLGSSSRARTSSSTFECLLSLALFSLGLHIIELILAVGFSLAVVLEVFYVFR